MMGLESSMGIWIGERLGRNARAARLLTTTILLLLALAVPGAHGQTTAAPKTPPALGTLKSISGNQLVLTTDAGSEVKVQLPADVKVLRVPPGSKDLQEATPLAITDLQPGDRILVRLKPADDGSSLVATTVIAMKKSDIADKQAREREEWQKHGIGGLVKTVDATNGTVTLGTLTAAGPNDVVIHVGKDTVLRRYAPGSVKFDDAKAAPIAEIRAGDQLRARGSRSADGSDFTADEIVSGSFRNIAGPIAGVDAGAGTLTVTDVATKKPVELKVTTDSQMRKLPPPMAQRIAMRLKGESAAPANAGGTPATGAQAPAGNSSAGGAPGGGGNAAGVAGAPQRGGGDLQQMLSRLPVSPLSDFQKGDVVMIVAASDPASAQATVITLLGGVEPILQASTQSQAASILSPWSLSQGGGGDAGTP
jgi:hypothetical protein